MVKYEIRTHELHWMFGHYEVEADSEEEAIELVNLGEGQISLDFDVVDQIEIDEMVKIND